MVLLKILWSFQKTKKNPPCSFPFVLINDFVYYDDELVRSPCFSISSFSSRTVIQGL